MLAINPGVKLLGQIMYMLNEEETALDINNQTQLIVLYQIFEISY